MTGVPTMDHVLKTFAYHLRCIATSRPKRPDAPYCDRDLFGLSLGSYGEGCPCVHIHVMIKPSACDDSWGAWAQVSFASPDETRIDYEGAVDAGLWHSHGNRSGGGDAYAALCAPVIAWVAAYHARAKAGA